MEPSGDRWRLLWIQRLNSWQSRLDQAGLGSIATLFGGALKPLRPVAAQLLWISQPGFALFGQFESIGGLAALLDEWPDHPEHG